MPRQRSDTGLEPDARCRRPSLAWLERSVRHAEDQLDSVDGIPLGHVVDAGDLRPVDGRYAQPGHQGGVNDRSARPGVDQHRHLDVEVRPILAQHPEFDDGAARAKLWTHDAVVANGRHASRRASRR